MAGRTLAVSSQKRRDLRHKGQHRRTNDVSLRSVADTETNKQASEEKTFHGMNLTPVSKNRRIPIYFSPRIFNSFQHFDSTLEAHFLGFVNDILCFCFLFTFRQTPVTFSM